MQLLHLGCLFFLRWILVLFPLFPVIYSYKPSYLQSAAAALICLPVLCACSFAVSFLISLFLGLAQSSLFLRNPPLSTFVTSLFQLFPGFVRLSRFLFSVSTRCVSWFSPFRPPRSASSRTSSFAPTRPAGLISTSLLVLKRPCFFWLCSRFVLVRCSVVCWIFPDPRYQG